MNPQPQQQYVIITPAHAVSENSCLTYSKSRVGIVRIVLIVNIISFSNYVSYILNLVIF